MFRAAADGDIGELDEAQGGVEGGGFGGAEVGAGVGPGELGVGEVLGARPVLHGDDGQVGLKVLFADDVFGEFAEGEAVADGEGHVVDVGLGAGVGDGALGGDASDEVGAVEKDDLEVVVVVRLLGAGSFEEVAGGGLVGPEVDAGVLEVDDDGVEVGELGVGGVAVGGLGSVEADDGEVGGGVGFGGEMFGVLFGGEAVFGGEDLCEVRVGVGEEVDGAVAVAVETGLVGEDGEVVEGFEGGEVGLFEDVDAGEGGGGESGSKRRSLRQAQGRLFDCGACSEAVSAFAQEDRFCGGDGGRRLGFGGGPTCLRQRRDVWGPVIFGWGSKRRSFDCGARDGAASAFAQDDALHASRRRTAESGSRPRSQRRDPATGSGQALGRPLWG